MNFAEWRGRILEARQHAGLSNPWSLVECPFPVSFHDELRDAWRNCAAGAAELALHSTLRMSDLGLVFLAAITEMSREHGREGALWPSVRSGLGLHRATEAVLFAPNGHPRHALKDAIESACLRFGLRNVIGLEGTQEWFGSVFLQVGFTRKGAVSRLPEWLAGFVRPIAVSRLLEPGSLKSDSFSQLWHALAEFRRGNSGQQVAEAVVRQSCWVKPAWCDALLKAAREKGGLGTAVTGQTVTEENAPTFLNGPWLVWDDAAEPTWELEIAGLDALGLSEHFYRVVVGNAVVILQKQTDGLFAYQPGNTLRLPVASASDGRVDAVILNARGSVIVQQEIRLFDPDADIVPFKIQAGRGEPADGILDGHIASGRDYWLLVANDLTANPQPGLWTQIPSLNRTLWRFDAAALATIRVCFADGELRWQHGVAVAEAMRPGNEMVFAKIEDGGAVGGADDTNFFIRVEAAAGVEIRGVRWRGKSWPVVNALAGPIPGVDVIEAGVLRIQIRGRANGAPFLCHRELPYSRQGVLERSETGRRWGSHFNRRSVRQLVRNRYRVMPPHDYDTQLSEWMLLAGEQQVTRLREGRTLQLREAPGYGESLCLRKGPFNSPDSHIVIGEIVDTGLFSYREVTPPPGALWDLKLWQPVEIDADFSIVHGVIGEMPVVVGAMQSVVIMDTDALVSFPDRPCDFLFLAYKGARIGGWWREDTPHRPRWSAALAEITDESAVRLAALMMRWGKLPILSARFRADVQEFARRHPATTLRAWVGESSTECGLEMPEIDEAWMSAVRGVFRGFRPADEHQALELAECLHRDANAPCERLVLDTLERLGPIDPILMGRILSHWIGFAHPPPQVRQVMRAALMNEWHVEPGFLAAVAGAMGVDGEWFLESVLTDGIRAARGEAPQKPHNLNLAMSRREFRVLLASRIVAESLH